MLNSSNPRAERMFRNLFIQMPIFFIARIASSKYNQPQQQQNPPIVCVYHSVIPDAVQMMMGVNQNYLNSNK